MPIKIQIAPLKEERKKNNKQALISSFPLSSTIKENQLIIGGCSTVELAKKYGTPLYIIDETTFLKKSNEYINNLKKYYPNSLVLYAAKAFATKAIFTLANKIGLGLDVVSGGELYLAVKTKFKKENIYFHGNNKLREELEFAIKSNIGRIICDNFYELELLQHIAKKENKIVSILIRLTPGIECHTHDYIKTGHLDSKFGFDLEYTNDILDFITNKAPNLNLKGFHAHIGSQIFELKPFTDTIEILLNEFYKIKTKYKIQLTELNLGGGLGISYTHEDDPISIKDWVEAISSSIKTKCKKLNLTLPKLICEPGRSIIGPSGITLYTVGSSKQVPKGRKYISVDGGMADNPRPITYQAKYTGIVANKINMEKKEKVTIAGRYCETGDILIKDIYLPKVNPGDIIAISNTGAYNYSMSSNYNMVPRPACVLVKDGHSELIIEREDHEDLIAKHKLPTRLH